jgi:hypothetical protein
MNKRDKKRILDRERLRRREGTILHITQKPVPESYGPQRPTARFLFVERFDLKSSIQFQFGEVVDLYDSHCFARFLTRAASEILKSDVMADDGGERLKRFMEELKRSKGGTK